MVQRPSTRNRVIIWTQRDNEGLNKSGYRRDLGRVVVDRNPMTTNNKRS